VFYWMQCSDWVFYWMQCSAWVLLHPIRMPYLLDMMLSIWCFSSIALQTCMTIQACWALQSWNFRVRVLYSYF
jgi:hypothetical protein